MSEILGPLDPVPSAVRTPRLHSVDRDIGRMLVRIMLEDGGIWSVTARNVFDFAPDGPHELPYLFASHPHLFTFMGRGPARYARRT